MYAKIFKADATPHAKAWDTRGRSAGGAVKTAPGSTSAGTPGDKPAPAGSTAGGHAAQPAMKPHTKPVINAKAGKNISVAVDHKSIPIPKRPMFSPGKTIKDIGGSQLARDLGLL